MDLEEITALLPVLEDAISTARAATPNGQEATKGAEGEYADEAKEVSDQKEAKADFKDSQEFKDAVMSMSNKRVDVILKAKKFLDEKYDFKNTCTTKIMADVLATQTKESFKDEEIGVAFRMLKKNERLFKICR